MISSIARFEILYINWDLSQEDFALYIYEKYQDKIVTQNTIYMENKFLALRINQFSNEKNKTSIESFIKKYYEMREGNLFKGYSFDFEKLVILKKDCEDEVSNSIGAEIIDLLCLDEVDIISP